MKKSEPSPNPGVPNSTEPDQEEPPAGIVQPMIDEMSRPKGATETPKGPPRGPVHPPEPAELDQDAGGGYNPDGTYPQT